MWEGVGPRRASAQQQQRNLEQVLLQPCSGSLPLPAFLTPQGRRRALQPPSFSLQVLLKGWPGLSGSLPSFPNTRYMLCSTPLRMLFPGMLFLLLSSHPPFPSAPLLTFLELIL